MFSNHPGLRSGAVAIFALAVLVTSCTPPPATISEADKAAIEASTNEWAAAAEKNDWAAVAMLYTEDAVAMAPNAPASVGRAAVQASFETFPPLTSMNLTVEYVQGVGDLAYVIGSYTLTMMVGEEELDDRGKYVEIRRKQADGKWLIAADIYNSDVPLAEADEGM